MKDNSRHSTEYNETALALLAEDVLAMKTDQLEPFVNDLMKIVKERRENEKQQETLSHIEAIRTSIKTLQNLNYYIYIETERGIFEITPHDETIVTIE